MERHDIVSKHSAGYEVSLSTYLYKTTLDSREFVEMVFKLPQSRFHTDKDNKDNHDKWQRQ